MTDDTKKPREFWIVDIWDPVFAERRTFDSDPNLPSIDKYIDVFHVIEKSAYDESEKKIVKVQSELLRMEWKAQDLYNQCEKLAAALKQAEEDYYIPIDIKEALAEYEEWKNK